MFCTFCTIVLYCHIICCKFLYKRRNKSYLYWTIIVACDNYYLTIDLTVWWFCQSWIKYLKNHTTEFLTFNKMFIMMYIVNKHFPQYLCKPYCELNNFTTSCLWLCFSLEKTRFLAWRISLPISFNAMKNGNKFPTDYIILISSF